VLPWRYVTEIGSWVLLTRHMLWHNIASKVLAFVRFQIFPILVLTPVLRRVSRFTSACFVKKY